MYCDVVLFSMIWFVVLGYAMDSDKCGMMECDVGCLSNGVVNLQNVKYVIKYDVIWYDVMCMPYDIM